MSLSKSFHQGNRQYIQAQLKAGEVFVISAHSQMQRSADTTFFSQSRDFFYLCGINEPDWTLVILSDDEYLIAPELSRIEKIFDGGLSAEEAAKISGVKTVHENRSGWDALKVQLKKAPSVQISAYEKPRKAQVNPAQARLLRKVKARTKAEIVSVHPLLHKRRSIKQAVEIAEIQKAIDVTGEALMSVKSNLITYSHEFQLSGDITGHFLRGGSAGHAYDPIVAAGLNACTLHYIENSAELKKGELVLLDVGAEVNNYAADITRTWTLSAATQRQTDVHDAVDQVRKNAIKLIKPGVTFADYFEKVDEYMGEELVGLQLIQKPTRENVREFFPHGVSHMLGLDVHDVSPGEDHFKPGMVLTVEPGIYINKERIGVRIEDDILVTDNGAKNLSKKIPHEL